MSGLTAETIARELAKLVMDEGVDPKVRLNAIRVHMQHSRDVLRYAAILGGDRIVRTVELGSGADRIKLTQIERQLKMARATNLQAQSLLSAANDFVAGEHERIAALPHPTLQKEAQPHGSETDEEITVEPLAVEAAGRPAATRPDDFPTAPASAREQLDDEDDDLD